MQSHKERVHPAADALFLLFGHDKKTAHFTVFVKRYFEKVTKNWAPHFCETQPFLT